MKEIKALTTQIKKEMREMVDRTNKLASEEKRYIDETIAEFGSHIRETINDERGECYTISRDVD
jgi:hypothetical protein